MFIDDVIFSNKEAKTRKQVKIIGEFQGQLLKVGSVQCGKGLPLTGVQCGRELPLTGEKLERKWTSRTYLFQMSRNLN